MDKKPPLSAYKVRKTPFEESMQSDDPQVPEEQDPDREISMIFFWVVVALVICGTTAITIGIGMMFGLPWALVCAGTIALSVGVLIGMDS